MKQADRSMGSARSAYFPLDARISIYFLEPIYHLDLQNRRLFEIGDERCCIDQSVAIISDMSY